MASEWLFALTTCAVVFLVLFTQRRSQGRLPPGPRPLPLVGNVLDFPTTHLGREFRDLSRKHGDVVYMKVLGQSIILLGSYSAACDLLEKRSSNYSHRPESVMVKLTNLDWIVVFKNHGPEWRKYRRAVQHQFLPPMLTRYEGIQLSVTHNLLYNLLRGPKDFSYHIKFSFAASILRIAYGVDLTRGDKRHYKLAQRLAIIAEDVSTPGRHAVEAFPSMQRLPSWFPGSGFKKLAEKWRKELVSVRDELFDSAKEKMKESGIKDSAITRLLDGGEDEEVIRNVTATIYAAGADTTNSSLHAFFVVMALYPDVQRKAQAELDAVIGSDRLPKMSDRQSLPYVNALTKEVLRWHIVAPIGVPHRSDKADEYEGYLIPGGSIVMVNAWAISRDEAMYPDPERFDPERYLKNGRPNADVRDPGTYVFGFGRRKCPGKDFAEASLFLNCASILHAFNVSPPLDEKGAPVKLDVYMGSHMAVSHPDPFDCRIAVRDTQREALITAASRE